MYIILLHVVFQKVNDLIEMVAWCYKRVTSKLVLILFV